MTGLWGCKHDRRTRKVDVTWIAGQYACHPGWLLFRSAERISPPHRTAGTLAVKKLKRNTEEQAQRTHDDLVRLGLMSAG